MGSRVGFGKIIGDCFTPHSSSSPLSSPCSCFWVSSGERADSETKQLVLQDNATRTPALRLKDIISGNQTLGFHLKPNTVTLKVAMHCDGCAKGVEKHNSKMAGVTSYEVDLENKMVIAVSDGIPVEVAESLSKIKLAELWDDVATTSSESMDDED